MVENRRPLEQKDFEAAASLIGCPVATIRAVAEVESSGSGFNRDGTVKLLFEGHWFWKFTNGAFKMFPEICHPSWTRIYYGKTQQEEHARFKKALGLDPRAAMLSTSWGAFQIMGFNHNLCEFTDVESFVNAMSFNEQNQLDAFVLYILHTGLADELLEFRWKDFARLYNGPLWMKNDYAGKLERAYEKWWA
jgi:hypothetical protein